MGVKALATNFLTLEQKLSVNVRNCHNLSDLLHTLPLHIGGNYDTFGRGLVEPEYFV